MRGSPVAATLRVVLATSLALFAAGENAMGEA